MFFDPFIITKIGSYYHEPVICRKTKAKKMTHTIVKTFLYSFSLSDYDMIFDIFGCSFIMYLMRSGRTRDKILGLMKYPQRVLEDVKSLYVFITYETSNPGRHKGQDRQELIEAIKWYPELSFHSYLCIEPDSRLFNGIQENPILSARLMRSHSIPKKICNQWKDDYSNYPGYFLHKDNLDFMLSIPYILYDDDLINISRDPEKLLEYLIPRKLIIDDSNNDGRILVESIRSDETLSKKYDQYLETFNA